MTPESKRRAVIAALVAVALTYGYNVKRNLDGGALAPEASAAPNR